MNSVCGTYSRIQKYLTGAIKLHRQFQTQSIQMVKALSYKNDYSMSTCCFRNNIRYKRFYCQTSSEKINEKRNRIANEVRERYQKKFDEFVSIPENKKHFQILELEIDVMRHNAEKVPNVIKTKEWMTIVKLPTKTQRVKYLRFLWRNEKTKENNQKKKELNKMQYLTIKETKMKKETDEMKYGLQYNTLFLRIYQTSIAHFYNSRLMQAIMFEPKIVFDCGYEDNMVYREIHNCAKQLQIAFSANRNHAAPLHQYFCNLKKGGILEENLLLGMPTFLDVDFPATVTSQSYLDLFPKDQLVYLTPHTRTEMTEYDANMVYIIGAMVDKMNPQPLSLAKAKKEGIRMAKLPIEKYLDWGCGSTKSFTLNQMMKILLDLRYTGDWNQALKNIPTRKLKVSREYQLKKLMNQLRSPKNQDVARTVDIQDFTFANRKKKFES